MELWIKIITCSAKLLSVRLFCHRSRSEAETEGGQFGDRVTVQKAGPWPVCPLFLTPGQLTVETDGANVRTDAECDKSGHHPDPMEASGRLPEMAPASLSPRKPF